MVYLWISLAVTSPRISIYREARKGFHDVYHNSLGEKNNAEVLCNQSRENLVLCVYHRSRVHTGGVREHTIYCQHFDADCGANGNFDADCGANGNSNPNSDRGCNHGA
jgi:hypothetical protein